MDIDYELLAKAGYDSAWRSPDVDWSDELPSFQRDCEAVARAVVAALGEQGFVVVPDESIPGDDTPPQPGSRHGYVRHTKADGSFATLYGRGDWYEFGRPRPTGSFAEMEQRAERGWRADMTTIDYEELAKVAEQNRQRMDGELFRMLEIYGQVFNIKPGIKTSISHNVTGRTWAILLEKEGEQ